MDEVSYSTFRAQHYHQLAIDAGDARLKEVLEAITADMSAKVVMADPGRQVSGPELMQEAMDERIERRIRVRRRGWLSVREGAEIKECIVWDESTIGPRLVVAVESEIFATLYLCMSLDFTSGWHCRVVWRSNNQIGVEFLGRCRDVQRSRWLDAMAPSIAEKTGPPQGAEARLTRLLA